MRACGAGTCDLQLRLVTFSDCESASNTQHPNIQHLTKDSSSAHHKLLVVRLASDFRFRSESRLRFQIQIRRFRDLWFDRMQCMQCEFRIRILSSDFGFGSGVGSGVGFFSNLQSCTWGKKICLVRTFCCYGEYAAEVACCIVYRGSRFGVWSLVPTLPTFPSFLRFLKCSLYSTTQHFAKFSSCLRPHQSRAFIMVPIKIR